MHDSSRYGTQDMQAAILHHLTYTVGKDADHATTYDWRMALSHALRDRIVDVWFASTRRSLRRRRQAGLLPVDGIPDRSLAR
jgi:starch phosphorylase